MFISVERLNKGVDERNFFILSLLKVIEGTRVCYILDQRIDPKVVI